MQHTCIRNRRRYLFPKTKSAAPGVIPLTHAPTPLYGLGYKHTTRADNAHEQHCRKFTTPALAQSPKLSGEPTDEPVRKMKSEHWATVEHTPTTRPCAVTKKATGRQVQCITSGVDPRVSAAPAMARTPCALTRMRGATSTTRHCSPKAKPDHPPPLPNADALLIVTGRGPLVLGGQSYPFRGL